MSILNKIRNTILPTLRTTKHTQYNTYSQKRINPTQSYRNIHIYEQALNNYYVNRCCRVYIETALACGYTIDTDTTENDKPATQHYLENLFSKPEGIHSTMTWSGLNSRIWKSFLVLGDCFLEPSIDPNYDVVNGYKYIHNNQIRWSNNRKCYTLTGQPDITYEPGELVHIYEPSTVPEEEHWGVSVIDSCGSALALLTNAMNFNNNILENKGLNPGTILSFDKDISDQNFNSEIERLNIMAKENREGGLLAIRGATFQNGATNNKDMSYMELMRLARDIVISAFGVPPQKMGIIETANLGSGSGDSQNRDWKKTFEGKSVFIEEAFNNNLKHHGFNERFHFNPIDTTDRLLDAQIDEIYIRNGVYTIDEVRNRQGLDKLDNATTNWGGYYR